jgi:hypothetical protein
MSFNLNEKTLLLQKRANIITENEYNELIGIIYLINEAQDLNEGLWEKAKYALSKLGRYKAGGKILGKGKVDAESAAKIKSLLKKEANKKIDQLDDIIKEKLPEFPNNKKQEDFVDMCLEIAKVYDSLVAATQLDPEDKDFLPADAANEVINDLREYVKEFLDTKLAAVYSVTNENQEIDEADEEETDDERLKRKKGELSAKSADTKDKIEKGLLQSFDSERIKTLKSWKLPLTLMGAGAAFGGIGWLIKTLCFDEKEITYTIVKEKLQFLYKVKPGEGWYKIFENSPQLKDITPNSPVSDYLDGIKAIGGGDLNKGIDLVANNSVCTDPTRFKEVMGELATDPSKYGDKCGELFRGSMSGRAKIPGDPFGVVNGATIYQKALTSVVKTAIIKTGKYTLAASVLKGLGVALLAGGIAVKLARWKGKKSSRAQVLNDLYQSLRPVEATKENPIVIEPSPDEPEAVKKTQPKTPDKTETPPPSNPEADTKTITNLNRNSQIALVLSRTNPQLSLFSSLGLDSAVDLSDGDLGSIIKDGTYQGKKVSDNAKKLATVIQNSRKSPDSFIKAYAKLTGTSKKENRAKAKSLQPGTAGQAPIKENSLISLLNEAAIDNLLSNLGVSVTDVATQAYLAKLVNAMYVGTGGGEVLDPESHKDPKFKEEYGKVNIPLASKEKGDKYVYLDKLQDKNKTQPDIDKFSKVVAKDSSFKNMLNKINSEDELANFLVALFIHRDNKGGSLFSKDKSFANDAGKVKAALFGLNSRIKDDNVQENQETPLPADIEGAYNYIDKNSTLKGLLKNVNTLEEFYQLVLRAILPYINPSIRKVDKIKSAIAKAANTSTKYKNLLEPKKEK